MDLKINFYEIDGSAGLSNKQGETGSVAKLVAKTFRGLCRGCKLSIHSFIGKR